MIYNNIYLISADYVKKNTSIMSNVEAQFIEQHILEAQNINMQQIVGNDMYDAIMGEFVAFLNSGEPVANIGNYVSAPYLTLVDSYFKTILMYFTVYYSMYDFNSKITNKGVVNQTSDNSHTSEFTQVEKMRKDYKQKAEAMVTLLIDYIIDHSSEYPLFRNENCTGYFMNGYKYKINRAISSIYLGNE